VAVNPIGRFREVLVEGVNCDSTCRTPRVNDPANDQEIETMTGADAVLLFGALAGGFVSGLAGFGTALMALGIWLYVQPPAIAVPLVLICSVSAQLSTLPAMWRLLDFKLAWPFVAGGLAGMPLGAMLVSRADPQIFKLSVGVMLLVFPVALYLIRAPMAFRFGGRAADAAIGFAGASLADLPACPARSRHCGRACAAGARISGAAFSNSSTAPYSAQPSACKSPTASSSRTCFGSRCWRCPAR
jgi:Sulfite exporter TauE/SafE